jgi:BirA family biotin operon repressor/biotin-[acetyl-CoA-carboxylase] ligase
MSLLLPAPTAQDAKSSSHSLSLIPLLAGASLAATLTDLGVLDVGLKWPNDVQIGGKKAAGILCEVLPTGDIIVGVGINTYFAGPPPTPEAVALAEFIAVDEVTIDHCVAVFISTLRSWCEKSHDVVSDFIRSELSTLGASVEVSELDGSRWTGQATGLSPEGHLQVTRDADGVVVSVVASDIRHLYQ